MSCTALTTLVNVTRIPADVMVSPNSKICSVFSISLMDLRKLTRSDGDISMPVRRHVRLLSIIRARPTCNSTVSTCMNRVQLYLSM